MREITLLDLLLARDALRIARIYAALSVFFDFLAIPFRLLLLGSSHALIVVFFFPNQTLNRNDQVVLSKTPTLLLMQLSYNVFSNIRSPL